MDDQKKPTRIAFCITDLDPGGAERSMVQLVTRLDRNKWEPFVCCLSGPGSLVDVLADADIPVTCLGAGRRDVRVIPKLVANLRRVRPALLQTFLFHANIAGRIAGRLAGVKRIVSGIRVAERRSRLPLWIDRFSNWLVDRNVCVSEAVARFSAEQAGLNQRKILVIPNGVDVERFAQAATADYQQFGIPSTSRTVIFVGRLDPQKGPMLLLQAAEQLIPNNDGLHFLFVGDGPMSDELAARVAARQMQNRIHFAGWRPDVPELLKAAVCLALPSHWEGMPNVVLEAMAAARPVVANRAEGVEELLRHNETGLLVDSIAAEGLAAAINRVLSDPQKAKEMAHAAQSYVKERFTHGTMVDAYDQLYRSLLQN